VRSTPGNHDPSPRQREIADAVAEHGSVAAAATALGIAAITVDRTLSAYHQRVCAHRLAELESEMAFLRDRHQINEAARRLERVVGRIERAAVPVSHRRLSDGGTRAREQRRLARTEEPDWT
jgi:hypothetical protein